MRRTITVLTVAAMALAGCGTDDDTEPEASPTASPSEGGTAAPSPSPTGGDGEEPSPSPSEDDPSDDSSDPSEEVAAMTFTECEAQEFVVPYPAEWQVNEPGGLVAACRVFHPGPVDLPDEPQGIDLNWAVTLNIDNVPFDDVVAADPTGEVLASEELTVDGLDARRSEVRSDGVALVPEGERQYGYAIDLDGRTLFATTYSIGATDYERDKRVLDRMVEGLQLSVVEPISAPEQTNDVMVEPTGEPVVVTELEIGGHVSFDRVVLTIGGDGEAGWDIGYEDDPRSQGSGQPVTLEGDATLRIAVTGVALPTDAPAEPRDGPDRLEPQGTRVVREVLDDAVFEGRHEFFVGVDQERPYRVTRLPDPQRIVVDVMAE